MLSDLALLNKAEDNLKWFIANSSKIREDFEGKVIAIGENKIIASAENTKKLLEILEQKGIDDSEVLLEKVPLKNEISIL